MMIRFILSIVFASAILWASPIQTTKEDSCVVKKFKVYKSPQWTAKIELQDGRNLFFISPKALFSFYFKPSSHPEYLNKEGELQIKSIWVTNFDTLEKMDAKKSFYVYGSHNVSPIGDDLPAFSNAWEAKSYADKNNGKRVISFAEMKPSLIELLNMN